MGSFNSDTANTREVIMENDMIKIELTDAQLKFLEQLLREALAYDELTNLYSRVYLGGLG